MGVKSSELVGLPRLERIWSMKAVLQGFRGQMDERLQPLGITTAQWRILWAVEANPEVSGAEIARVMGVTAQSAQALLVTMEEHGWIRRRASEKSERVRVAELTAKGRKVLLRGRQLADALHESLWQGMEPEELAAVDRVMARAVEKLHR